MTNDDVDNNGGALGPRLTGRGAAFAVDGWWRVTATGHQLVVPDGGVDVMWSPGRMPWIAGPDTIPHLSTLPAGADVFGVRLAPGAAGAMLRQHVSAIVNQRIDLDSAIDGSTARRLAEQLSSARRRERGPVFMDLVSTSVDPRWEPDPVVAMELARLRSGTERAGHTMSDRQLRRRFSQAMGYGPKFFERLCRLERFVALVANRPRTGLGAAAALTGYYDQAHLARDSRALTGCTPRQLVQQHR